MTDPQLYTQWKDNARRIVEELAKKDSLLEQHALWLEASEENTLRRGEDILNRIRGVLSATAENLGIGLDFFMDAGNLNETYVLAELQRRTGLDLGICTLMRDNIDSMRKNDYSGISERAVWSRCKANTDLFIGSYEGCIPPKRIECPYRMERLGKRPVEM